MLQCIILPGDAWFSLRFSPHQHFGLRSPENRQCSAIQVMQGHEMCLQHNIMKGHTIKNVSSFLPQVTTRSLKNGSRATRIGMVIRQLPHCFKDGEYNLFLTSRIIQLNKFHVN